MYAGPLYEGIPGRPLEYASTILACISIIVIAPIYVFYKKGPAIRNKSKFAQSVNETWQKSKEKRGSVQDVRVKEVLQTLRRVLMARRGRLFHTMSEFVEGDSDYCILRKPLDRSREHTLLI